MLLASCVNTPIDYNVFHNLRAHVARCSASCVNWTRECMRIATGNLKSLPGGHVTAGNLQDASSFCCLRASGFGIVRHFLTLTCDPLSEKMRIYPTNLRDEPREQPQRRWCDLRSLFLLYSVSTQQLARTDLPFSSLFTQQQVETQPKRYNSSSK